MPRKEAMHENLEENLEELNHTSALDRVLHQLEETEKSGSQLFMPDLNPLQMHYRAEIVIMLSARGWELKHWSVTGNPPFVCAYPVFVRHLH